jgi:hypothetical protein
MRETLPNSLSDKNECYEEVEAPSAKSDFSTACEEHLLWVKPFLAQFGQKLSEEDLCDFVRSSTPAI